MATGVITNADGTASFHQSSEIEKHTTPMLVKVFNQLFEEELPDYRRNANQGVCELITDTSRQLQGYDLFLHLKKLLPVGSVCTVDFKIDTYLSRNIFLELISQCKAAKLGYPFKHMQWVFYYFVQSGDMFLMDMAQVTPWVQAKIRRIIGHQKTGRETHPFSIAGTPNLTYQSFNLSVRDAALLKECPGVYLLRLCDHVSHDILREPILTYNLYLKKENLSRAANKQIPPLKFVVPVEPCHLDSRLPKQSVAQVKELLLKGGGELQHALPCRDDIERLTRKCEEYAFYRPTSRDRGAKLRKERTHWVLPEDAPVLSLPATPVARAA
ncbi:MAG: hypothetical protein Q7S87_09185 [Agitococcus sp.]|nr:hypothetical protein [Agitococcus sp.]MDO9179958.1 hypothetical protein [Agitococcus sp.]